MNTLPLVGSTATPTGSNIPLAVVARELLVKLLWPSTGLAACPLVNAATVGRSAANSARALAFALLHITRYAPFQV
jgi:hypothetical protein